MRLIDADALQQRFAGLAVTHPHLGIMEGIDAAPTIACERCYHNQYPRMCGRGVLWSEWTSDKSTISCDAPVDACSRFKEATDE